MQIILNKYLGIALAFMVGLMVISQVLLAQASGYNKGKTFTIASEYSMFPDSVRNINPRIYNGITYAAEQHYNNNTILIHIPEHFNAALPIEVVFWFHGWFNHIDSSLTSFKLLEQFDAADRNAIFVFPEGPVDAPDSYGGKLEKPNYFTYLLGDVMLELVKKGLIISKPNNPAIILAGHSGAYRVIAKIIAGNTLALKGVLLFDALYAEELTFTKAIEQFPSIRFIHIDTNDGGTLENSLKMLSLLVQRKLPVLYLNEDDCNLECLKKQALLFLHSNKTHNEVITNNQNFKRWLQSIPKPVICFLDE